MNESLLGIALVTVCSAIEGFAQVCLKKSVLTALRRSFWLRVAIAFFVVEAVLYTGALHLLDVGTAYSVGALSFVAVALFSQGLLKEQVDGRRWLGLGLILAGCALVASQG
ncbi:MAG: SMR family transporter [Magnetococcus sp. MYC-9]